MHGCLVILCPLKQYFRHAMIMDGWLKAECNEVMYRSSSNRTLDAVIHIWEHKSLGDRSLRQLQVQPLCRSAVRDIAALPTAFLSFA